MLCDAPHSISCAMTPFELQAWLGHRSPESTPALRQDHRGAARAESSTEQVADACMSRALTGTDQFLRRSVDAAVHWTERH